MVHEWNSGIRDRMIIAMYQLHSDKNDETLSVLHNEWVKRTYVNFEGMQVTPMEVAMVLRKAGMR